MSYEFHCRLRASDPTQVADTLLSFDGVQPNGPRAYCIDEGRALFLYIELVSPGNDVHVTCAYGGDAEEIDRALELCHQLATTHGGSVIDAQLDQVVSEKARDAVLMSWLRCNEAALDGYADGHYALRQIQEGPDGTRVMIEAIRCGEVCTQNLATVAVAFSKMERYEKALALFEKCRALEPDDPAFQYSAALTNFFLGRRARAVDILQSVLRNFPEYEQARELLNHLEQQIEG